MSSIGGNVNAGRRHIYRACVTPADRAARIDGEVDDEENDAAQVPARTEAFQDPRGGK